MTASPAPLIESPPTKPLATAKSLTLLLTAFEPSGDDLASAVIAKIKAHDPHANIYAFGGPKMQAAGATLIQTTTENPTMLAGAIGQLMAHRRRIKALKQWLRSHPIDALVPVDSPAANWSICQAVRSIQPQARILHLVAPQLWAWAPWRIRKLRRLTDHVMCLLPFEPQWLIERGVQATFVGHPLFDDATSTSPALASSLPASTLSLPEGTAPRLAILPGSRPSEIRRNWPMMVQVVALLREQLPELSVVAALRNEASIEHLPPNPQVSRIIIQHSQTQAVLQWADVVLVVSGTATLQVASLRKPMVTLFNASRLSWELLGRWLIQTRTFTLPNLIGEWLGMGRIVPEFVPYFGQADTIAQALLPLLAKEQERQTQIKHLTDMAKPFLHHQSASETTAIILSQTGMNK